MPTRPGPSKSRKPAKSASAPAAVADVKPPVVPAPAPEPAPPAAPAESAGDRPERLTVSFDEAVRLTGLDAATIEAMEKEFPFLNAGWTAGGKKYFRSQDVEILRRAKALLDSRSLTLAGIKRRIEEEFGLVPVQPVHPEKMRKALYQVREELQGILKSLQDSPPKPGPGRK